MIEDVSCIRFKDQNQVQHRDFIEFRYYANSCYSYVGRVGGKQAVYFGFNCAQEGIHTIVHEVFYNDFITPLIQSQLYPWKYFDVTIG